MVRFLLSTTSLFMLIGVLVVDRLWIKFEGSSDNGAIPTQRLSKLNLVPPNIGPNIGL
jgi:hypothetical protein